MSKLKNTLVDSVPHLDTSVIIEAGAAGLHKVVGKVDMPAVLEAYNQAITGTFFLCVGAGAVALLFSFGMKWKSVKGKQAISAV